MSWKVKALLDSLSAILIAVGAVIAQTSKEYGAIIVAVGVGIKAASEYLYEQGIITRFGKR
jgi:hypothetical protein